MPDTFLRDAEVTHLTGIPRSTRYELIERGEFPKPIKLGPRAVAWIEEHKYELTALQLLYAGTHPLKLSL